MDFSWTVHAPWKSSDVNLLSDYFSKDATSGYLSVTGAETHRCSVVSHPGRSGS